jgi:hypothetical protein
VNISQPKLRSEKFVDNDHDHDNDDDDNNNNVIKKEAEKILKYKDLTIEIQRM